jgi:hypothetical protein
VGSSASAVFDHALADDLVDCGLGERGGDGLASTLAFPVVGDAVGVGADVAAELAHCAVAVPYWGGAVELMEVPGLAREGKIRVHVQRFPLGQVADVYRRLRGGKIEGRAVMTPDES